MGQGTIYIDDCYRYKHGLNLGNIFQEKKVIFRQPLFLSEQEEKMSSYSFE